MKSSPFQDPRTNDLLSRVSEDVGLLRQDIGNLVNHTRHHALPEGARDLAGQAKLRFLTGRQHSEEQLRALSRQLQQPKNAWIGGALLVGFIAAGIYMLTRPPCDAQYLDEDPEMDNARF